MQTNTNHYMMILGKSKVPDFSEMKISYKNKGFLASEMKVAMHKNGMRMTEGQRQKLIDDFKNAIELYGNLGNPKLTKILKKDGNIPKLDGSTELSPRALYTYIGMARCRLGFEAKSPEPQRGDRSGKNYPKEDVDKAVAMYMNKHSISEVAEKMNWSKSKTRHILTSIAEVKMRTKSECRLLAEAKINREKTNIVGAK